MIRFIRQFLVGFILSNVEFLEIHSLRPSPEWVRGGQIGNPTEFKGDTVKEVRYAMQLSNLSQHNITAGHEACKIWNSLLVRANFPLGKSVECLCHAMYASCLVRTGRDEDAINEFNKVLSMDLILDQKTRDDSILGKAKSLQRLLKYSEAQDEYNKLTTEGSVLGAATCHMRLGNIDDAFQVLSDYLSNNNNKEDVGGELYAELEILEFLKTGKRDKQLIINLTESKNPLHIWVSNSIQDPPCPQKLPAMCPEASLIQMIRINNSYLDDPSLLLLDDKVHLHRLLANSSKANSFWPIGITIPRDPQYLKNELSRQRPDSLWILKKRAGYGSHGNTILSFEQASQLRSHDGDEMLLQKMIEPSLLIAHRKFSIRVYVLYFSHQEVYVSSRGLVKFASMDATGSTDLNENMYMTNSGREVSMQQEDFVFLRKKFEELGLPFGDFWSKTKDAVEVTFESYESKHVIEREKVKWELQRQKLGIPKILGFDFVLDDKGDPWLVEVNRFPGLEYRDGSDKEVKCQVLQDAWDLARQRIEVGSVTNTPERSPTDVEAMKLGNSFERL